MSTRVGISAAAHSGHMPMVGELQLARLRLVPAVASELDTYKQLLQLNAHAGLRPIQEVKR